MIGIADREEAHKLAQRTTRELLAKGEDLTGSKIIIDANKQEIYKETQTGASSVVATTSPAGDKTVGKTSGKTQPDASFFDAPEEVDGSENHLSHEKVKSTLEHEAEKGTLGNVHAATLSSAGEHLKLETRDVGPSGSLAKPSSTEERKHSYSHQNEQAGKDVSYTEVTVLGEPDTKRAQALAQEAVYSLQGRKDILDVKELKVDAITGAICDQDGRFIAQLSQRRLSQSDTGKRRKSSGGIVNLPKPTEAASKAEQEKVASALKQKTSQSPSQDKGSLASAKDTSKKDDIYKMPGSFFECTFFLCI